MITAAQIRAARTALNWSASEMARQSGLSPRTISSIEASDDSSAVRKSSVLALKAALEAAGIEFIGTPDDGPGIRIHRKPAPPA